MSLSEEELWRQVTKANGMLADLVPRLIGALAIHLRVRQYAVLEDFRPDNLFSLGQAVQATEDIDFVIQDPVAGARQLQASGFEKSKREPTRYFRGPFVIDLIPGASSCNSIHIPFQACDSDPLELPGSGQRIWVAKSGCLFALKMAAYSNRHTRRDLADLAVLAIAGRAYGWQIRDELTQALAAIPSAAAALPKIRDEFSDPDGRGPGEFASVARSMSSALDRNEWEKYEDSVRGSASDAVRGLLLDIEKS